MFVSILDKDAVASPERLGGKGYGLWLMQQNGINVPPALVVPTSYCVEYMQGPLSAKGVMKDIEKSLQYVYDFFHQQFGFMPLLSVRSGARVSMPGMMDTVLNVGLDESNQGFWKDKLGQACVEDCRRRLIEMYGDVVKGLDRKALESGGLPYYVQETGEDFPAAKAQILGAIEAVFQSWNNERAKTYRKLHNIPEDWGTAVILQAMVFGNCNDQSCTGVMFTRCPDTGENNAFNVSSEFLVNGQGEDVVAGIKNATKLTEMPKWNAALCYEVIAVGKKLEALRKYPQDMEFTVQDGKLFLLQTRDAKTNAKAAIRIAVELFEDGVLSRAEALKRVTPKQYDLSQQKMIDPKFDFPEFAKGIPACSGIANGVIVKTAKAAIECKEPCVLVTQETNPDDIGGMAAAVGVLTMTGGATSHAAVVARSMNKPCVVGLSGKLSDFKGGEKVAIDGATGRVWLGEVPVVGGNGDKYLDRFQSLLFSDPNVAVFASPQDKLAGQAVLRYKDLMIYGDIAKIVQEKAAEVEILYLDLTGLQDPHEAAFNDLFGLSVGNTIGILKSLKKLPKNVKTIGLSVGAGEETIPVVSELEKLLTHEGAVIFFGDETKAVEKAIDLKTKAGEAVMRFGQANPKGVAFLSKEKVVLELLG